jgi:hypothetical protein
MVEFVLVLPLFLYLLGKHHRDVLGAGLTPRISRLDSLRAGDSAGDVDRPSVAGSPEVSTLDAAIGGARGVGARGVGFHHIVDGCLGT